MVYHGLSWFKQENHEIIRPWVHRILHVWGQFSTHPGSKYLKDCEIRCLWDPMGPWILDFDNFWTMYISCVCLWISPKMPALLMDVEPRSAGCKILCKMSLMIDQRNIAPGLPRDRQTWASHAQFRQRCLSIHSRIHRKHLHLRSRKQFQTCRSYHRV
jgi:hypothetical protein